MEKTRSYAVWTGASICCLILFICIGIQTSKAPLVSHTIMAHGNMVYIDDFVDSAGQEIAAPIILNYNDGVAYSFSTVIPKEIELINSPHLYITARYLNIDFYEPMYISSPDLK